MNTFYHLENVLTVICAVALVIGLYYLGASGYALMGLLVLFNLRW